MALRRNFSVKPNLIRRIRARDYFCFLMVHVLGLPLSGLPILMRLEQDHSSVELVMPCLVSTEVAQVRFA